MWTYSLALGLVAFAIVRWLQRPRRVALVPGPSSPSFLYGNLCQLLLPSEYGENEFKWQKQYGPVYRIKGCFSEDRLVVSDPVTLKHILNDPMTFERSTQQQEIVNMLIGKKTVFYVKGDDHRRVRGIMNPAFSPSSIRALPPLFGNIAEKLVHSWETMITDSTDPNGVVDVYQSLHSATLDGVGAGAIGYYFGAMDNQESELGKSHHNIITMSGVRTKVHIAFEAMVPYVPQWLLQVSSQLPTEAFSALRRNRKISSRISAELVEAAQQNIAMGTESGKDLLNVMVRGNSSAKVAHKMSNEEMQEQIPSLMIAGQDTTGNTLAMSLWELAKNPDLQRLLRDEITEAYERHQGDLSYSDIESLKHFNAFLKEVLRMHPGLPMSDRIAAVDTVLPLAHPIINTNGERMTEIPIPKGQHIIVASASYNRLESVWGPDAHVFRPARWLEGDPAKGTAFGPFAGLATFFGGPRVCIGWKFAITELQCLLPVLIRKFKFTLSDQVKIRPRLAVTLNPSSEDGKMCLPLVVEMVDA